MSQKRALVTGITGQDGAYLAKLLLDKGYHVTGAVRRTSSVNLWRLGVLGIEDKVELRTMDLLEFSNILSVIRDVAPAEVYNLGAQSFVGASFDQPLYTGDVDALGVTRLLEAIRTVDPKIRFYQASTSEMFGKIQEPLQTERTPFYPRSPYGVAKLYGHWMTVNYREAYDMHASCGILFNHESPLRGTEFVTRKVTSTLAKIRHGKADVLSVGNLEAMRDWGHAADYVRGMWAMLQQSEPSDYVLSTGECHSVREMIEIAGSHVGFDIVWQGSGKDETGLDKKTGKTIIRIDPKYYRPAEVDVLIGSAKKAHEALAWKCDYTFEKLIIEMVTSDLDRITRGLDIY